MLRTVIALIDILCSPLTLASAVWMRLLRKAKFQNMPLSERIMLKVGVYPLTDHYYQPLFNPRKHLRKSLREARELPGIDLNVDEQLQLLGKFSYNGELEAMPIEKKEDISFYYHNDSFESGDAEFLYNLIRHHKPSKIVEIGSGNSTLMAINAIRKNKEETPGYSCEHICIEPYEMPWLEKSGVKVIREKVEEVSKDLFLSLKENDILFIDSSHMIRPQGDVLFEFFEILPVLKKGVLVHVHDIFTPYDYPDEWIIDDHKFWNEQYLLEAFLVSNKDYKVIGSLNYLKHAHFNELASKCPVLAKEKHREPGSFWMKKVN